MSSLEEFSTAIEEHNFNDAKALFTKYRRNAYYVEHAKVYVSKQCHKASLDSSDYATSLVPKTDDMAAKIHYANMCDLEQFVYINQPTSPVTPLMSPMSPKSVTPPLISPTTSNTSTPKSATTSTSKSLTVRQCIAVLRISPKSNIVKY